MKFLFECFSHIDNKKIDLSSYDDLNNYVSNNIAVVKSNELRGAINIESGKLIIPTKYNYLDINTHYIKGNLPDSRLSDLYTLNGDLLYKNISFIKNLNNEIKLTMFILSKKLFISKHKTEHSAFVVLWPPFGCFISRFEVCLTEYLKSK